MGIQTMGTQGVDNGNGAGKQSQLQSLTHQNSLYSLTLDEVQNQLGDLGKPLTSMNLDELLKSVWTAELNHIVDSDDDNTGPPAQSGLQRQASLSLAGPISKKTVDEVWKHIQQEQNGDHEKMVGDKQITLGKMTLEDFLVKAGVVADSSLEKTNDGNNDNANVERNSGQQFPLHGQWMQYQQPQFHHPQPNMIDVYMPGQPISQHFPMAATGVMDCQFTENQMPFPSSMMGSLGDTTQGTSRKRIPSEGPVDKSVERRQKRMIKNRESAARSRARKQAYTTELEQKVSNLEEENARLKKRKELENLFSQHTPPPEPKYQLRRTSSSPF
ncbi:hypothetical protein V2J09_013526 [Rumex salicifolius]